jgi:hypothetical protein
MQTLEYFTARLGLDPGYWRVVSAQPDPCVTCDLRAISRSALVHGDIGAIIERLAWPGSRHATSIPSLAAKTELFVRIG